MKTILTAEDHLNKRIQELELKQKEQLADLKSTFEELGKSLHPGTILKNAVKTVVGTPGLKSTALDTAISFGAGFLGKKLIVRNSGGIFRKVAGTAVQFILANFVRNKIPALKDQYAQRNGVDV